MRPVLIDEFSWVEGSPFADRTVSPWHAFFNSPAIKRKIDNYAYIACKLHVKVVVNASPFYYGAVMVSYRPLPEFSIGINELASSRFINYSQRPHFWILPQNDQGGEMELPFVYHKNLLDITVASDLTNMGQITIQEVVDLQNANGVSGGAISLQFYAWASDVTITGPTYKLAVQSGKAKAKDEYGQGPVSRVASAVAAVAGKLVEVPWIGPFAKATEIGASAASAIASLFGFTNVPVIADVMPMKNLPFHSLASASIGEPVSKMTVDPKNELCIDPRTVGLSGGDELCISYFNQRESLLAITTWDSTVATNGLLFSCPVEPMLYESVADSQQHRLAMVPMALAASQFKYWRGDITFRIKAICSQYHKARLRITWDPRGDIVNNSDNMTTSLNKVVDLAPDLDIEFTCSFSQARHWLTVNDPSSVTPFRVSGGVFINNQSPSFTNGILTVRVLNVLSSPVTTSDVKLLIFVRGAENLEYMDPRNNLENKFSYFTVQSGKAKSAEHIAHGNTSAVANEAYTVYGGENIKSLRTLMRRSNFVDCIPFIFTPGGAVNTHSVFRINQTKMPPPTGFDPSAQLDATGPISAIPNPYSYSKMTVLGVFAPCYVGYRGSMIWHYNVDTSGTPGVYSTLRLDRIEREVPSTAGRVVTSEIVGSGYATNDGISAFYRDTLEDGSAGMVLTNQHTQTGLSASYPHYYPYRFCATDPTHWNRGSSDDETRFKFYRLSGIAKPASTNDPFKYLVVERMVSIGTDFNLFYFLNVPTMYLYSMVPIAP